MSNLNSLQKKQLEIMMEIDKVCRENNITYFLAYGTALGAVRHGGFIPWDDDIDIIMLREDYNIFINKCKDKLSENMFIQTFNSDKEYTLPFAKVRDSNTTCVEENSKHLNINHGVFIDVFPFDYVPTSKMRRFNQKIGAGVLWAILRRNEEKSSSVKKLISSVLNVVIPKSKEKAIVNKIEKYISKYNEDTCENIANLTYGTGYADRLYRKGIFVSEDIKFEECKLMIMKEKDEYLTIEYGDYMTPPPVEKRQGVHPYEVVDVNRSYKDVIK